MENRRLFAFLFLSVGVMLIWENFVTPRLFPPKPKPIPEAAVPEKAAGAGQSAEAGVAADQKAPADAGVAGSEPAAAPDKVAASDPAAPDKSASPAFTPNPETFVTLGSLDPKSGYAMEVRLSSAGASIETISLTDPQFRDLRDETKQVQIVGNNTSRDRSFSLAADLIDRQLQGNSDLTLETADWKLEEESETAEGKQARFSFMAPDGSVRVDKTYRLSKLKLSPGQVVPSFRDDPSGYTLEVAISLTNLSQKEQTLTYELQGPVGLLLENDEHTSKYRDIKIEFLTATDDITLTSQSVVKSCEKYEQEAGRALSTRDLYSKLSANDKWTGVFRYAGIDVQFFAALVAPIDSRSEEERQASRWIDRTYPTLVERNLRDARLSDVSFRMVSVPLTLSAEGDQKSVEHRYALFAGPKRRELLDPLPLAASRVLDYGSWFGFVARGMHWVLDLFYGFGMPYWLAIISLTVLVRGCMFPLSKKQAISAAKMKDLQPKLNELKLKYGDDKEKLARAQMELWRKHNINPVGGCVPVMFQLPVFVGLFTSLNTAVDLRMSGFLWIRNLAAPDALFRLPFELPYLGYDFSILPCITVALFLVQQKMFMPPAVDEQQEAQHKMMNIMTVFFGVLFWHQPAGLCVYYIASSLWGIAERKLLGTGNTLTDSSVSDSSSEGSSGESNAVVTTVAAAGNRPAGKPSSEAKAPGFLQKWIEMAQEAKTNAEKTESRESRNRKNKKSR
jgi:YidC/Oxa1 family membrane protein insertase